MQRDFPRQLEALGPVFDFSAEFAATAAVDPATAKNVDLFLEELFTNAVRHNPSGTGELRIDLERHGDCVELTLTDFAATRFDPTKAAEPDVNAPLEQRRPGGLGIHLIRKLADDVRYEYRDGVSRIIVTTKLR